MLIKLNEGTIEKILDSALDVSLNNLSPAEIVIVKTQEILSALLSRNSICVES